MVTYGVIHGSKAGANPSEERTAIVEVAVGREQALVLAK